jgi:hypothetical protein
MLKVDFAGIVTVAQSCTAFKKWGASSPPLAVRVQASSFAGCLGNLKGGLKKGKKDGPLAATDVKQKVASPNDVVSRRIFRASLSSFRILDHILYPQNNRIGPPFDEASTCDGPDALPREDIW